MKRLERIGETDHGSIVDKAKEVDGSANEVNSICKEFKG